MSAISDALKGIREVLLLQDRVERLGSEIASMSRDMAEMRTLIGSISDRVSRLEGFLDGAAVGVGARPRLPRA